AAFGERATAALQLAQQLGVDTEARRRGEQLFVEAREHLGGDGGRRLERRLRSLGDALRLLALSRLREMGSQGLLDLREALSKLLREGVGPRDVLNALGDKLLRVALPHRGRLPDPLVQERLRVGGLIALVVPVAP